MARSPVAAGAGSATQHRVGRRCDTTQLRSLPRQLSFPHILVCMGRLLRRAEQTSAKVRSGTKVSDLSLDRDLGSLAGRLDALTALVGRAAAAILATDPARAARRQKSDRSFVTSADEAAQAIILQGLSELFPGLPAICEEATGLPRPTILGECFALVDPLDGTREFLAGRPEFTVNLAIVRAGAAVLGIIAAPALGQVWRGVVGYGAQRLRWDPARPSALEDVAPIRASPQFFPLVRVMVSRSHLDTET